MKLKRNLHIEYPICFKNIRVRERNEIKTMPFHKNVFYHENLFFPKSFYKAIIKL